ncbi:amino acid transporter AVT6E-like [Amaranthus tricolor]|uniref:amino acid transporter AVT6E-like n=1 Tax=Amaranthus tricolor TaxID=29722 RepID=UPI002589143C|nr:amino acid transporter AVT6E-like [Amaranthus tricolor]
MAIVNLLVVIPVMTNAYVCHFNVQPIYNELDGRSPQKMNRVARITIVVTVNIKSNVITNFDTDLEIAYSDILNYIVRIGYILHLILVFVVNHFSLCKIVNTLILADSAPSQLHHREHKINTLKKAFLALLSILLCPIWLIVHTLQSSIWKLDGSIAYSNLHTAAYSNVHIAWFI